MFGPKLPAEANNRASLTGQLGEQSPDNVVRIGHLVPTGMELKHALSAGDADNETILVRFNVDGLGNSGNIVAHFCCSPKVYSLGDALPRSLRPSNRAPTGLRV